MGDGGEAEVELSTEHGAVIPATGPGVVVSAQTVDGQIIASGTF